ncbi:sister chromatid cohesion C-terminus-domain-containing protein [Scheffersomyces coipomensis]|uniref:sister chromatid cohesion C-terminus-domain-containing protein n=1 Tax=Scheffersomyces coipomensis TaxID=1788519 RepID=UPI00315CDE44
MEDRPPADLKDALAVTPLLHLIPKQDFSPFVTSSQLLIRPQEQLMKYDSFDPFIIDNQDELMTQLMAGFGSFLDEDDMSIEFQKRNSSINQNSTTISLPQVERMIYDSNISLKNVSEDRRYGNIQSSIFKNSRLSIRKAYDSNDYQKTSQHNQNYIKKFQREASFAQGANNIYKYDDGEEQSHSTEIRKRTDEHFESNVPNPKRKQETSSQISEISHNEVQKIIEDIESDTPHEDNLPTLIRLHDLILKFRNDQQENNLEVSELSKIERYCHKVLSEDISESLNELISILELESNIEIQNKWDNLNLIAKKISQNFLASRIIMYILNGNENDKSLFLEEYLNLAVTYVSDIVNNLVVPLFLKLNISPILANNLKPFMSTVLGEVNILLNEFSVHISKYEIDEGLLTKLEYLSLLILFTEDQSKDKNSLIMKIQFDALKLEAVKVIVCTFQKYTDQREFILQEVLEGLDKHSDPKVASKFKLPNGSNVNIASLLLIKLIQTKQSTGKVDSLDPTSTESSFTNSCNVAKSIATYLVNNLMNASLAKFRSTTQQLITDILCILFLPEWVGSTLLLSALVSAMVAIQQQFDNSNVENFVIEMFGLIAERVGYLKGTHGTISQLGPFSDLSEIKDFQIQCEVILKYMKSQKRDDQAVPLLFVREKLANYLVSIYKIVNDSPEDLSNKKEIFKNGIQSLRLSDGVDKTESDFDTENVEANGPDAYVGIILAYDLNPIYDSIIEVLMKSLEGQRIKSKSRSIRILSTLIENDSELLIMPKVQSAVSGRLRDSSPLVRDAVIDLISKYMNSKEEYVEQFYVPICECINDSSISVRKRVIRLAKEMYVKLNSISAKVYIANKLLRRLNDEEESLQETSSSFLHQLWFTNVVDSDHPDLLSEKTKESTEVMGKIVTSGSKNLTHFEDFLGKLYSSAAIKDLRSSIIVIVNHSLNIVTEGTDNHSIDGIQRSLKLIATLISVDSSLVDQDQLISLQHFLVDGSIEGDINRMNTLIILRRVIPSIKTFRPSILDSVKTYLLKQLTKFNVRELNEAMPVVWILCEAKGDSVKLANASTSCMKHIKPYIDSKKHAVELKADGKLLKLLHLLGNFGRHCNFEKFRAQFLKSGLGLREKESISSLMMKFLLYFCKPATDDTTRNIAVINVINLCISHPRLFLSDPVVQVFDNEFKTGNIGIVHSIVQGFCEFIKIGGSNKQNSDRHKKSNEEKSKISALHGVAPMSFSDGVCSGLIQRYMDKILHFCLEDDGKVSYLPIQFLQLVLGQGFANIRTCTPTIIALISSQTHIKNIGIDILKEIYEKHESLVQSSLFDGINKSIDYRSRLDPLYYKENSFIPVLYSQINRNHSNRKKFMACLCRHIAISNSENDNQLQYQRNKISYMSYNIAETNFTTLEEPVMIIRAIDEIMIRDGADLKSAIESIGDNNITLKSTLTSQLLLALLSLREYLMNKYSITNEIIELSDTSSLKQNIKPSSLMAFNINHIDSMIDDPVEQSIIASTFLQRIATFI